MIVDEKWSFSAFSGFCLSGLTFEISSEMATQSRFVKVYEKPTTSAIISDPS